MSGIPAPARARRVRARGALPSRLTVPDQRSLPVPPTSLVGRERELAEVCSLILGRDLRLLTLTGPGGVGKTRLALRAAAELAGQFADGANFVALAPVRDPDHLIPAIAQSLGVRERHDTSLIEVLRTRLRSSERLLILDNFEHLLGAGPLLGSLLASCPRCIALVTSRAALRLYGEHTFLVSPLTVPNLDPPWSLDHIAQTSAVRLFVDRARAARSDFRLTAGNAPAVAAICDRLDGLPLAIELAAARVTVLPPAAMLARLDRRLPFLASGPRDQPERHRALRNTIAWSYDLLAPEEQAVFRHLAVCAGGFTLEAARAIAGPATGPADADAGGGTAMVDLVSSLVDQSLLQRAHQPEREDGEPRFAMLETIREFGLERLATSGEGGERRRRHATYFLQTAEALAGRLAGADMAAALDRLETDLPNIRLALTWARDHGEAETTLRLASALYSFWNFRSQVSEGRRWLDTALALGETTMATRVDGLLAAAALAELQGDLGQATAWGAEALALAQDSRYQFGVARALFLLGVAAEWQGDLDRAAACYEDALARRHDFGARHWTARLITCLADIAHLRGDRERAEALARDGLALARTVGHAWTIGLALGVLANVAVERGDLAPAIALYDEKLAIARELGDQRAIAGSVAGLAAVIAAGGGYEQAARLLGAARALADAAGFAFLTHHQYYERVLTAVRGRLDEPAFAAAWEAGQALAPDLAIAEATTAAHAAAAPSAGVATGAGERLTRREREVLRLLAAGRSDREIAAALFIGHRTVNVHVGHIYAKLGVNSRAAATAVAIRRGLVDGP